MTESKATAGPWIVKADKDTGWPRVLGALKANNKHDVVCNFSPMGKANEANARLIVTTVNVCFALCPDDPLRAAEAIPKAFSLLGLLSEAMRPMRDDLLTQIDVRARALLASLQPPTDRGETK